MFIPPSGPTNTVNTGCGNDNVHISKADGLAGLLGLYEVNINGQKQYMTEAQLKNTEFNLRLRQRQADRRQRRQGRHQRQRRRGQRPDGRRLGQRRPARRCGQRR